MSTELVTVAYNSGRALLELIDSAGSGVAVNLHATVFLHSTHRETVEACAELSARTDVAVITLGLNAGLARSWNDGILKSFDGGADVVVVANDDIVFGPGDFDQVIETARAARQSHIITCAGPHSGYGSRLASHGYACFAVNPILVDLLGCFDENFWPAYCEDQDMHRRARLVGLREANCPSTQVRHTGSATIQRDASLRASNAITQALNTAYYHRKWGGAAGSELWEHPFDDPAFGVRIDPRDRHHPYGANDRADLRG